ncbi:dienelactone hydrolase family protein [Williamsia sp. CHRR-6]|uniref:dienelactone hydrolase family protein n=1 Tax=Williamsia sp. CHRR-6 TaxID=2835871 RepID=UPI001BDA7528|nr:dienelactone hydrolase family protein [Williamsia sp. CHRR-6]MBT0566745.1 dienelactone hydrolase family protein [Williamsia sp. CHRR-6]
MTSVKKLYKRLSRRGPHRVLRGDMAIVGLPGVVYTPESGTNLPAVAFGHGWLTTSKQYTDTLEHLASWGIVVGVPDTERGPLGSDRSLAADLETTLQILSSVRLGSGAITVHTERLGLVGHGLGASAAVLAAGDSPRAKVLAALYPSPTSKAVEPAARRSRLPALVLAAGDDLDGFTSNALTVRTTLGGDAVTLRSVPKAGRRGLVEGFSVRKYLGDGSADKRTQRDTRAILTGFLLAHLTDDKTYRGFADPDEQIGSATVIDPDSLEADDRDQITKLLRK